MMEHSDHDLLVTISRDMIWLKERLIDHEKEDTANHALTVQSVSKAHSRIDESNEKYNNRFNFLIVSVVLTIVLFGIGLFFK